MVASRMEKHVGWFRRLVIIPVTILALVVVPTIAPPATMPALVVTPTVVSLLLVVTPVVAGVPALGIRVSSELVQSHVRKSSRIGCHNN